MIDWKESVFVAESESGGVILITAPNEYDGTKEQFMKQNGLDRAENLIELQPIQIPVKRKYRNFWYIKDGKLKIDFRSAFLYYKKKIRG
jgi:hypothetical protein